MDLPDMFPNHLVGLIFESDSLVVYSTKDEFTRERTFKFILPRKESHVSVLLDDKDIKRIHKQLNDYLNKEEIK